MGGWAGTRLVDPAEIDVLRRQSRLTRERLEGAIDSLRHEPRNHRSRWSATELTGVRQGVYEVGRCAALLYEGLPVHPSDTVPRAAELTTVLDRYLAALATAVAARQDPRPGELRAAFDAATRSGPADPAAPDGVARARGRALTPCLGAVTAVEALVRCLVPVETASGTASRPPRTGRGAHGRHARPQVAG